MLHLRCQTTRRAGALVVAVAVVAAGAGMVRGDAISDAINAASAKLVSQQVLPADANSSAWEGPGYGGFNGNIIAGLTSAYQVNGVVVNKTAAENGATALIAYVNQAWAGKYATNEIYGLTQISTLQANPNSNPYHDAAYNYFANTIGSDVSGFVTTLDSLSLDKASATIDLARLTTAAYAVNAPNKAELRTSLISMVGLVADYDSTASYVQSYPTRALGAAVWALAKTGKGLDNTVITGPTGVTDPYHQNTFGGKMLSELPAMLSARIESTTHTFFAYLTSDYDSYHAYTEDTAFGILGLDAADFAGHTSTYAADIAAARLALTASVNSSGETCDNPILALSDGSSGGEYAGMALQALSASPTPEPASVSLLALGAVGLLTRRRRARN